MMLPGVEPPGAPVARLLVACDQDPHDQAEIVAGDVYQIAFVQVLAAAQPGATHAAAVEHEGEAAFDQFAAEPEPCPGNA